MMNRGGFIMAVLIESNGSDKQVEPSEGSEFSLKELQGYVDGYIELVYLANGKILVVNEEGLLKRLPLNNKASLLARQPIVGNVVMIEPNQIS
ncbi:MAG: DUF3846 domain-containing protein [Pelagibacteraceae bacterium TMED247]|nr:MAG: DUF3846 domain-containing protein [Pelagibacteraceae bacterium TMED247]|tara:strand:- start:21 stop:299 length:279 start_codon:yes stop_codon:yes gene_type:complete